jgi:hypothetical protein
MKSVSKRILEGEFKTVNRYIFEKLTSLIRKISKRDELHIPIWIVAFVIIGGVAIFGFQISYHIEKITIDLKFLAPFALSTLYICLLVLLCENLVQRILGAFANHLVDAIPLKENVNLLENRLELVFSNRKQVLFATFFTIIIHVAFILPNPDLIKLFGWGIIVANLLINFFHGICVYLVFSYINWVDKEIRNYEFNLYPLDPRRSEEVQVLSQVFNSVLYSLIIMVTIVTVVLAVFEVFPRISVIISIAAMWITASILFFFNHSILTSIISRAKWKTLRQLQSQIIKLQSKEDPPSSTTLDHIAKLIDHHNKIQATPNSALSLRSLLEFLNSLFLPTLGVVIGDFQDISSLLKDYNLLE